MENTAYQTYIHTHTQKTFIIDFFFAVQFELKIIL
jgi:hypothetical protein